MTPTWIHVLGSGDAFNSGGRLFPCFYVESKSARFLIDCGASALYAMKRAGIDPDGLDAVLVSHFHGDHFAGLPFLELELAILRKRTRPLIVAGPAGIEQRVPAAMDVLYPATSPGERLRMNYVSWKTGEYVDVAALRVRALPAIHTPETNPHSLRIEVDGKIIAYSGDTEWTDALVELADSADLFICESSTYALEIPNHLSYHTLMAHRDQLRCKRLLLTHMSDEMLANLPVEGADIAHDGMRLEI